MAMAKIRNTGEVHGPVPYVLPPSWANLVAFTSRLATALRATDWGVIWNFTLSIELLSLLRVLLMNAQRTGSGAQRRSGRGARTHLLLRASGPGPIGCVLRGPGPTGWRSTMILRTIFKYSQTAEKRVARGRMRKVAAVPDSMPVMLLLLRPMDEITYPAGMLRLTAPLLIACEAFLVFFSSSVLRFSC
ncbi:hypothetical protein GGI35DRAFT_285440 [Trichoderma velutinum]